VTPFPQDAFERWLSILPSEIMFTLPWLLDSDAGDFYVNPRYLRGSDFLMRWSQGRWSEEILVDAFTRNPNWIAIPFGPSCIAPEEPRELEAYFERLEASGVGKRPDLLILARETYETIRNDVRRIGVENIPFTPEKDLRFLIDGSVCAVEVENSLWVSKAMPHYGKGRPSKADAKLTVFLRSQKVPTVIIKDRDLKPLRVWQRNCNVPIYVFHVFFDQGFFISFDRALSLIKKKIVEVTEQTFFAPGGATTKKGIYKIWYTLASPLGEIVESPNLTSKVVQDRNGHILPYVHFSGGRLDLSREINDELDKLAHAKR
jgi:AccI restriction endonuclease